LTKKFRGLGLKHALSAKLAAGELVVIDNAVLQDGKSKVLAAILKNFGWKRALIVDGPSLDVNFVRAANNIESLDVLPSIGINVYDILKKDTLVLTRAAVTALEERFK
jgi:large subunit ribosomal protein L4